MSSWLIAVAARMFGGKSVIFKWLGIVVGLIAVAVVILWLLWTNAEQRSEIERLHGYTVALEAANKSHLATIDSMHKADAAKDKALAEREADRRRIAAERDKFQRAWKEALRNEPEVRAWADEPVPDAVRILFQ